MGVVDLVNRKVVDRILQFCRCGDKDVVSILEELGEMDEEELEKEQVSFLDYSFNNR